MTVKMRVDLTPEDYIRQMFIETKDGVLGITKCSLYEPPITYRYQVNWTQEDVERIVQCYTHLASALERIGWVRKISKDEEALKKKLSDEDFEIWNIYVKPYEPFEVDWTAFKDIPPCDSTELIPLILEIHERSRYGELIEEEQMLWKQYCMWEEEQSRKRIPFNRRSAAGLIQFAMRYECAIRTNAPETVLKEEGYYLAEKIVMYYAGRDEPIVWD